MEKIKKLMMSIIASACLASTSFATENIVLKIDSTPQQEMTYGMDFERLWHWGFPDPEEAKKFANLAVKDINVDYVRVAVDGLAEFFEGKFNWDAAYKTQLECMAVLKEANPNIKFFVSPRPIHEANREVYGVDSPQAKSCPFTCFPFWIGEFNDPYKSRADGRAMVKFHWDKAADYFVRHIKFLQDKGYNIAYMDVKNENDRYYFPAELSQMVDSIRKQLGDKMPKVIGPSSFERRSCEAWVNDAIKINRTDFFDIISSHNTRGKGGFDNLKELSKKLNKPLWNTELHGFQGPDDIAVQRSKNLWEHFRGGFGGINDWLSLGSEEKEHKMLRNVKGKVVPMRTYYIFKHLVNTSGGGNYLNSTFSENVTKSGVFINQTAAFIKGDTLTIWFLNASEYPVKRKSKKAKATTPPPMDIEEALTFDEAQAKVQAKAKVKVKKEKVPPPPKPSQELKNVSLDFSGFETTSDEVEVMYWGPSNPREGTATTMKIQKGASSLFLPVVENETLYCFTFKVKRK